MRHFAPAAARLVTALFGLSLAVPAAAAPTVYSFQVGPNNVTYAGPGALGAAGTTFNRVDYTGIGTINAVANAKNSQGVAVPGVSLTFTSDGRFDAGTKDGFGNATPVDTTAADPAALLQNFATVRNGTVGSIMLSGLPPNAPYTLILYGTNGTFADGTRGTQFSVYKDAGLKAVSATANTSCKQDAAFATPDDYVKLTGTTDAGGCIFATYQGAVGDEGDFNGLQISLSAP